MGQVKKQTVRIDTLQGLSQRQAGKLLKKSRRLNGGPFVVSNDVSEEALHDLAALLLSSIIESACAEDAVLAALLAHCDLVPEAMGGNHALH